MSDQPVAKATTYTKHNKRTSIYSAGYEPAIPVVDRPQTYALDRRTTGIGLSSLLLQLIEYVVALV
jgi:hypothetical protein